jgi:hypothetical protein
VAVCIIGPLPLETAVAMELSALEQDVEMFRKRCSVIMNLWHRKRRDEVQ